MFLWKCCEAVAALTLSNTDFYSFLAPPDIPFSSFIVPGGVRGRCPGCQLLAGGAEDEQVADLLLWGAGECREISNGSCHISILLPQTSTGWEWSFQCAGIFLREFLAASKPPLPTGSGILNQNRSSSDFPVDNGSVLCSQGWTPDFQSSSLFAILVRISNNYLTPKIHPWFPRIDFNYASLEIEENRDLGIHLWVQ